MIPLIQTEWKRWYNRLTEEEKKTYHRDYSRQARKNKQLYYLRTQRWMLWRYIDEKQVFSSEDIKYIKSCQIN